MSRRFERKVSRQRRRQGHPRIVGVTPTTWQRAAELANECQCPVTVLDSGGGAIFVQHHHHGCPAVRKRSRP